MPPKTEEKACQLCKQPFSFTKRRHYCSLCNRTVCANCSTGNVGLLSSIRNKEGDNVCVKCKRGPKGGGGAGPPAAATATAHHPPPTLPQQQQQTAAFIGSSNTASSRPPSTTATGGGAACPSSASTTSPSTGVVMVPSNRPMHSSTRSTHSEDVTGAVRTIDQLLDSQQHLVGPSFDVADDMEDEPPPPSSGTNSANPKAAEASEALAGHVPAPAVAGSPVAVAPSTGAVAFRTSQQQQQQRTMLPSTLSMSLSRSLASTSFIMPASSVQSGRGIAGAHGTAAAAAGVGEVATSFRPTSLLRRKSMTGARPPPAAAAQHYDAFHVVSESVRKRHTSSMKLQPAAGAGPESVKNASFLFGSTPMGSLPPQFFAALRRDASGGVPVSSSAWQSFVAQTPKVPSAIALDHVTLICEADGVLAKDHLHACINLLIDRHSMLRTTFRDGGLVVFPPGDCDFKVLYYTDKTEKNVRQTFEGDIASPFSSASPAFKVRILSSRTVNTQHTLAFVFHRATACTTSIALFMEDLRILYQNCHKILLTKGWDPQTQTTFGAGSDSSGNAGSVVELQMSLVSRLLPRIPAAYEDYCIAEKDYIAATGQDNRQFWLAKTQSASPLEMPTSCGARPATVPFTTNAVAVPVHGDTLDALLMWARRECGASADVPLLSAFAVLLKRFTGQDTVTIAVHSDERNPVFADTFGPMANFLTLNIDTPDSGTCASLVAKVRQQLVESTPHKDFPFSKITTDAETAASQGRFPFAQAAFIASCAASGKSIVPFLLGVPGPSYDFAGLRLNPSVAIERARGSIFELSLHMWEARGETALALEYATSLYDSAAMRDMVGCFAELLRSMANPTRRAAHALSMLRLLPDDQLAQQMHRFNSNTLPDTAAALSKRCGVHGLVSMDRPLALALSMPEHNESLTYAELDAKSNQLAAMLHARHNVTANTVVAIAMPRSVTQILCVLGVLKAGGGYLPLDLSYPLDRLSFMLADSNVISSQLALRRFCP